MAHLRLLFSSCRRQSTWCPASQSVRAEPGRQLTRVHKAMPSGAKKQCDCSQGGPSLSETVPCLSILSQGCQLVCLPPPHKSRPPGFCCYSLEPEKLLSKGLVGPLWGQREMQTTYFAYFKLEDNHTLDSGRNGNRFCLWREMLFSFIPPLFHAIVD